MAKITEEMKEVIAKARIFAVATASKSGEPNVVPVRWVRVFSDDEILIMDNYMNKTAANLKANSMVAISAFVMEPAVKGFQFKGDARIETSGKIYDDGVAMVKAKSPERTPKAAVVVKVKSIYLTTPGRDAGKEVT